jgi:uncharacterized membrane protein
MIDEFGTERAILEEHRYPEGAKKLLEVLQDGEWHRTYDLAPVCGIAVHSRISELRGYGVRIIHNGRGGRNSAYQLAREGQGVKNEDQYLSNSE